MSKSDPKGLIGRAAKLARVGGPDMYCARYRHPSLLLSPPYGYECQWFDAKGHLQVYWFRAEELEPAKATGDE